MTPLRTPDGLDLYRVDTLPSGTPRAAVLLVHGLGEHLGRYAALTARLVDAGHAVHAFDQRGHGRSPGARGAIPSENAPMTDLAAMIDAVRSRHAALPLVLLGHSMGGVEAARFVAESLSPAPAAWSRRVDLLALSSPALAADITRVQRVLLALGRLAPDQPAHNGLQPQWVSRDPAVVAAYQADPLVHDRLTPRLGRWILDAGEHVRAAAPRWHTPTLLMWAGADRCVAPRGSQEFAAAAPPALVHARCFETLYHEIFNEPQQDEVVATLLQWLDAHLAVIRPGAGPSIAPTPPAPTRSPP